nr:CCA tRNA nucleotidyltransferase [Borreliella garinii]
MNLGKNNKNIIKIGKIFKKNNYEFYLVGGALRDLLLNKQPCDFDFATNATPEEIITLFPNNIKTGIKHGTIGIIFNKKIFEITTYRIEKEYENNRTPKQVEYTKNLIKDLERRDFTINAIAMDIFNFNIIDCYNGKKDLNKKIIRCIGNSNKRLEEDALRILRAARFSSTLNFKIEKNTLISMKYKKENILMISKERIKNEFHKLLEGKNIQKGIYYLKKVDFFKNFFNLEIKTKLIKKTALLSKEKFYLKAITILTIEKPIKELKEKLTLLKFSNKEIKLILFYRSIIDNKNIFNIKKLSDIRYLLSKSTREHYKEIIDIYKALKGKKKKYSFIVKNIKRKKLLKNPLSLKDLKINGKDIQNLEEIENKNIGKILNTLLSHVIENPKLNTKQYLIERIKTLKINIFHSF